MHELGQHRTVLEKGASRILYSGSQVTKAFESRVVRLKNQALSSHVIDAAEKYF